jgi:hypothetical protein
MKKTLTFLLFIGLAAGIAAQSPMPYEHAAGIRAGYSSGITYKAFLLHRTNALQADLFYNSHGLNISALYVIHYEPFRKDRWLVYGGAGPFGGEWDGDLSLGLTGMIGIEYILRQLPINIGLDWKPMWNIYRNMDYDLLDFGLTIRYRFSL